MLIYKIPNKEATINPTEAIVKPKLPFPANNFCPFASNKFEKLFGQQKLEYSR